MELVAVNVVDVKAAERYYVDTFGMVARAPLDENGRPKGFAALLPFLLRFSQTS